MRNANPCAVGVGRAWRSIGAAVLATVVLAPGCASDDPSIAEWPVYGGDQAATKYSPLADINRDTVHRLQVAWEWQPNEVLHAEYGTRPGKFQNTPLMIDNVLYVSTPYNRVVALDAETGDTRWTFDPEAYVDGQPASGQGFVHRGVAAWRDGERLRIFLNTRHRLICLDAVTGIPVQSFGVDGTVDLGEGLVWEIDRTHYASTSPPVVYEDLVILGNGVGDRLMYRNDPPGDVRAFDARTGEQVWSFHTIPQEGEFGNETWEDDSWRFTGHTNVWAPMSLDEERGLLYLPVGTPSNDYYGGRRKGDNLFAESLVCLDAATGERQWHYQFVHHGLWDYDLPAAPNLVSITVGERQIDAVAQVTKMGFTFVFDRVTGDPVWPIEERPVAQSDVPGERTSATQPFPTRPPPFAAQGVTLDDAFDLSRVEGRRAGGTEAVPARGSLHAPVHGGHGDAAGRMGRGQLGWGRVRCGDGAPLSQDRVVGPDLADSEIRSRGREPAPGCRGRRRLRESRTTDLGRRRTVVQAAVRAPRGHRSQRGSDRLAGAVRRQPRPASNPRDPPPMVVPVLMRELGS